VRWLAIAIAVAWSVAARADDAPSAYRCGAGGKPVPGKGCECGGGYVAARDAANVAVCKAKPTQRPPKTAKVEFRGDTLQGATIAIDGIARGTAPQTIDVAPGRHLIEVTRDGYHPFSRWIELQPGGAELIEPALVAVEPTTSPSIDPTPNTPPPPIDATPNAPPPAREPQLAVAQPSPPVAAGRVLRVELELGANTTAPLGVSANGVARSEFANPPGVIGLRGAVALELMRHLGVRASIHFVSGNNGASAVDGAVEIEGRVSPTPRIELFAGVGPSYGAADISAASPSVHLSGFGVQARIGAGVRFGAYALALVTTTTADDVGGATFGWLTFCFAASYRFPI
jgi:hypothetical protein